MNERIKELEDLAFDIVWDSDNTVIGPSTHFRPDGFEKKFAELIIRECSLFVFKQNGPKSALNLLGHFGVEE